MFPNFLVIGAAKCGTTSLYEYLKAHPDVYMSPQKEVRFFSKEENWARGLAWYESFFDGATGETAVGEASPQYTCYPYRDPAPRIAATIPHAKLIYLIRNPVQRVLSAYQFQVALGNEFDPIEKVIRKRGPSGEPPFALTLSSYGMQIESYMRHFPRDALLVVKTEDLKADRPTTMARIFSFLGVDPQAVAASDEEFNRTERLLHRRNARRRWLTAEERVKLPGYGAVRLLPRPVRDKARSLIHRDAAVTIPAGIENQIGAALRPDLEKLAAYMGPDFDAWGLLGDG